MHPILVYGLSCHCSLSRFRAQGATISDNCLAITSSAGLTRTFNSTRPPGWTAAGGTWLIKNATSFLLDWKVECGTAGTSDHICRFISQDPGIDKKVKLHRRGHVRVPSSMVATCRQFIRSRQFGLLATACTALGSIHDIHVLLAREIAAPRH